MHTVRGAQGAIGREARCKLEEQSQFKMHKTRASELASSASRSKPLAAIDPARVVYQVEPSLVVVVI